MVQQTDELLDDKTVWILVELWVHELVASMDAEMAAEMADCLDDA
jgi:hypothetical protein